MGLRTPYEQTRVDACVDSRPLDAGEWSSAVGLVRYTRKGGTMVRTGQALRAASEVSREAKRNTATRSTEDLRSRSHQAVGVVEDRGEPVLEAALAQPGDPADHREAALVRLVGLD